MTLFLAFAVCAVVFLGLVSLRRHNDERGTAMPGWTRGVQIAAGIGYFGFGMWLLGEIGTVMP